MILPGDLLCVGNEGKAGAGEGTSVYYACSIAKTRKQQHNMYINCGSGQYLAVKISELKLYCLSENKS